MVLGPATEKRHQGGSCEATIMVKLKLMKGKLSIYMLTTAKQCGTR